MGGQLQAPWLIDKLKMFIGQDDLQWEELGQPETDNTAGQWLD